MPLTTVHYNIGLVVVSILIAMGASYVSLSLADRVRAAATRMHRHLWLSGGAVAMGFGIWCMHYLGMLAVELPVPVYYYRPTVLLSLLLAIIAAMVALNIVSGDTLSKPRLFVGGLFMASGIGGMHYVGMAAMRSQAMEQYNLSIVVISVVAAAVFAWLALWIAFSARHTRHNHAGVLRFAASAIMGLGISAMHYIAMAAVHFTLCDIPVPTESLVKVDVLSQWIIAGSASMVLLVALGTATFDKWRFRDLQRIHEELVSAQQALLESQQDLREVNSALSEMSLRDGLTGLYNRRHFDNALETEMSRARRGNTPISLLMIDVDHFKLLNDTYGHLRGDECLRQIARVLEEQPHRGYDLVARYGGEEFVMLLPGADANAAHLIAEMLRMAILDLAIENARSPVTGTVTISIGICCRSTHGCGDTQSFVGEADVALYAAKQKGRNRTELGSATANYVAAVNARG